MKKSTIVKIAGVIIALIAAFIYFLITYPTSKVIERIERRMRRGDKR